MIGRLRSLPTASVPSEFDDAAAGRHTRIALVALPVVWAFFGLANLGSYRGYQLAAVLVLTATAGWIAVTMAAPSLSVRTPRPVWVATLVVLAVGSILVFQPTYLPPHDALRMRMAVLVCMICLGVLWTVGRAGTAQLSLLVVSAVLGVTSWFPIRGVPVPGNDVWFLLQQSSEGLARGENMYRMTWTGVPPGQVTDAFAYLPMSSVLFAPARWLTGDVRWGIPALVGTSAVLLLVVGWKATGGSGLWFAPACLLILTPGHPLQVEMTWTEPLIFLLLLGAVLATVTGSRWWAVGLLALALASKQHVWLLLPLFAAWRPFGLRQTVSALLGAGLLCLPWIIADRHAMYDDTIRFHIEVVESARISTIHSMLAEMGVDLPLPVAGVAVLATLAWCWLRLRQTATPAQFCLAMALALFVANLVSKHAYFNQWWLCGSLLLAGLAFSGDRQDGAEAATKQNSL